MVSIRPPSFLSYLNLLSYVRTYGYQDWVINFQQKLGSSYLILLPLTSLELLTGC